MVWEGAVKVDAIQGWAENPRINLAKKTWQDKVGNRDLSQAEVYELMKSDKEVKLKELRDDILKNGLRDPLTLSFDGKLLDGNRRFFAVKFALETIPQIDPNKRDLETVQVFVLVEGTSEEDERNVLVEENFSPSLKIEWPDYVKAEMVVRAREEEGLEIKEIAQKFNWPATKVRETLKINEIVKDFEAFATEAEDPEDPDGGGFGMSEQEAQVLAASNYQFFNEAQKSFFDPLKTDVDFKIQFFKWIKQKKFGSFPEVRIAYKAWKSPQAKAAIMQDIPAAAKKAKTILDYNDRVIRNTEDAVWTIQSFLKFLRELTVEEINSLPAETREELKTGYELVVNLVEAASAK